MMDLGALGFAGVDPAVTDCPAYHPSVLLKPYLYGYLNASIPTVAWSAIPSAT